MTAPHLRWPRGHDRPAARRAHAQPRQDPRRGPHGVRRRGRRRGRRDDRPAGRRGRRNPLPTVPHQRTPHRGGGGRGPPARCSGRPGRPWQSSLADGPHRLSPAVGRVQSQHSGCLARLWNGGHIEVRGTIEAGGPRAARAGPIGGCGAQRSGLRGRDRLDVVLRGASSRRRPACPPMPGDVTSTCCSRARPPMSVAVPCDHSTIPRSPPTRPGGPPRWRRHPRHPAGVGSEPLARPGSGRCRVTRRCAVIPTSLISRRPDGRSAGRSSEPCPRSRLSRQCRQGLHRAWGGAAIATRPR